MTPPPVQIRTNYLLAYDLLETAAWFSQLSAHADVHLDRIQRAVAHLRGQHVQSPPGQETPNTIHESPRRDMAWLLRNDPWAAAIAAHVRFYDQAALADEILRLRAENERLRDEIEAVEARHSSTVASQGLKIAALRSELAAATRERETPLRCEYESADGQQRCILSKHDEHLLAWKARPEASNANPL